MQKALEQMNLKLTEILSDITGVTGRHPPGDPAWDRAPEKLAKYRTRCKASEAEIAPGLDRDVPGGAPVRAEASARGLAVHLGR